MANLSGNQLGLTISTKVKDAGPLPTQHLNGGMIYEEANTGNIFGGSAPPNQVNFVFNEDKVLDDALEYIKSTYSGHYSGERAQRIQVTEFIMSHCDNPQDALRFNVLKYTARYGHKNGFNKADLLKSIHYLVMMLDYHNKYLTKESV